MKKKKKRSETICGLAGLVFIYFSCSPLVADVLIDPPLPDRSECRAEFEAEWDAGFQTANEKRTIYKNSVADLRKEIAHLRNQPLWDVPVLRDAGPTAAESKMLGDALLGLKTATGLFQTYLGSMAKATGAGAVATTIDYASSSAEWVAEQLRNGQSISGIVSSFGTKEFALFVGKKAVASLDPIAATEIQIVDSLVDAYNQDKEYRQYIGELNQQITRLNAEIDRYETLMDQETARIKDTIENGTTIFCKNEPPVAVDDSAETIGRDLVRIYPLGNDSDPEKLELRLTRILSVQGGRATTHDNGTFGNPADDYIQFAAEEGFSGIGVITYEIVDDLGLTATAQIRVSVAPSDVFSEDSIDDELDSLLSDAVADFDRAWTVAQSTRSKDLQQRLTLSRQGIEASNREERTLIDWGLEVARIGMERQDVMALDCAESIYRQQPSDACRNYATAMFNGATNPAHAGSGESARCIDVQSEQKMVADLERCNEIIVRSSGMCNSMSRAISCLESTKKYAKSCPGAMGDLNAILSEWRSQRQRVCAEY